MPLPSSRRHSISQVLVGPFIISITVLIAFVAFFAGDLTINFTEEILDQLNNDISHRIQHYLTDFIKNSEPINDLNKETLLRGVVDYRDIPALQGYLASVAAANPGISSVYLGTTGGGLIGAGRNRTAEGVEEYHTETPGGVAGEFRKIRMDGPGTGDELLVSVPDFDSRLRPWYIGAVRSAGPYWTDP